MLEPCWGIESKGPREISYSDGKAWGACYQLKNIWKSENQVQYQYQ